MKNLKRIPHLVRPVVTIGTFDGVHRGHAFLLEKVVKKAREIQGTSFVITYHPHPREILQPNTLYPLITPESEKKRLIEQLGIDYVLWLDFNEKLAQMTAEHFVKEYFVKRLHAEEIILGYDCGFGRKREGNFALTAALGNKYHFNVELLSPVLFQNEPISSRRIRDLLLAGEIEKANQMLGRCYSITGKVIHGKNVGRKIGFPTANLELDNIRKLVPRDGIYATLVRYQDKIYFAVTNIGMNPTVDETRQRHIEAHLLDFDKDIYDETLEIVFLCYLRNEQKFSSLSLLQQQIGQDVARAREYFYQKFENIPITDRIFETSVDKTENIY